MFDDEDDVEGGAVAMLMLLLFIFFVLTVVTSFLGRLGDFSCPEAVLERLGSSCGLDSSDYVDSASWVRVATLDVGYTVSMTKYRYALRAAL